MYCTVRYNAEWNVMQWKSEQWSMKDTAYYQRVLESLELGCEVKWNEIHWHNYWSICGERDWLRRDGIYLPNKLGLGNLHDSLYVEYWGWEYGLPEKSPPERKKRIDRVVKQRWIEDLSLTLTKSFCINPTLFIVGGRGVVFKDRYCCMWFVD